MTEISTHLPSTGLKDPILGIPYAHTVDLDGYVPGDDVDDDALVLAEITAFRAIGEGPASASIIVVAAAAHYRSEAASAVETRVLAPEQFAALGAALLTLGLIDASEIEVGK